jgi:hemoglobin
VSEAERPPTVYEWAGGSEAFDRLTEVFYRRHVQDDEILGPVFANMPADHPHHVALWLAEVFGGPAEYSEHHGGYAHMVAKHIGLSLTEQQRARWVQLIGLAADDAGLPSDPEFRSAFIAYIEWGTRLALHNSQPGADPPPKAPMPHWDGEKHRPTSHKSFPGAARGGRAKALAGHPASMRRLLGGVAWEQAPAPT